MGAVIDSGEFGSRQRQTVLRLATLVIFSILFLRLYQLQLVSHTEFGKKSEENSVRTVIKDPVRGDIYDRTGRLIVDVGPSFAVTAAPASFDSATARELGELLQMDPVQITERVNKGRQYSRFSPVRIKRDVDFKTLSAVEEHLYLLRGISYEVESKRLYNAPIRASHLLGYCKEITEAQLARYGDTYRQGDLVGSSGLESSYETFLRGERGFEYIAVNSKGQQLGPLEGGQRDIASKEGFDLVLSLDAGLQACAESLMTQYKGALVAMDPNTGGILAMVSKPDFDPSVFSGVTASEDWTRLNTDDGKPLFNRATMSRYPPGSTFKMVVAAAALEEGLIDEHYRITCTGGFRFGRRLFRDLHVHGSVNVVEAIQKSCNVFFYQLVLKVGLDKLNEYGKKFGFGHATGVDIAEETSGLLPSEAYYDRVYGKDKWTLGNVVSLGVGQGEIGVSPLQMARYASSLANGGILLQPHAVDRIYNKRVNRYSVVDVHGIPLGLSPKTIGLIREGMRAAVELPGGTGSLARIPGIESAGKTGTAENPHGKDHAWYIGFAPFDNPKIAVAVLLENSGFGGAKAAPLARALMHRYLFGETLQPERAAIAAADSRH